MDAKGDFKTIIIQYFAKYKMLLWVLAGAVAHTNNSNSFRGKRIKQIVIWAAIAVNFVH